MTLKIGLTGSIATGKSTTAKLIKQLGIPVFDADAEVHRLYAQGGEGVAVIEELCPQALKDGAVDRARLSAELRRQPELLEKIEAGVHPLVRKQQDQFWQKAVAAKHQLAVFDIPLLYETGREANMDYVIVVSTDCITQRNRALERPGMTTEKFEFILSKQVPDRIKRDKADFVIDTSISIEDADRQLRLILNQLNRVAQKENDA